MMSRKICLVIVVLLFLYDVHYLTTNTSIHITDPKFSLLGPYNTTDYAPEDVYNHLIDIKNFTFKINANPCDKHNTGLLLMIIISSNPINFDNRRVIRNTWGKNVESTKTVFLVGESENDTISSKIYNESVLYGDIVEGTFKDVYHNMTYKHVMGLKWVAHHCPMARYILKSDDDVVVNIHALRRFLSRELSPWGARDLIACQVLEHAAVQRSYRSKWRVSPGEYRDHYYPAYCAGWAVIYSKDVVYRLLKTAQKTPYFWIDDVHITGIIAQQIGVPRTPLKNLILSRYRANILTNFGISYSGEFLFGPPDISVERILQIWNSIPE